MFNLCEKPVTNIISKEPIVTASVRSLFFNLLQHLLLWNLCAMSRLITVDNIIKANLAVDLGHALVIGKGSSFRSEDDVLRTVSSRASKVGRIHTISSSDSRLVSGTTNQMKAAPIHVSNPNRI